MNVPTKRHSVKTRMESKQLEGHNQKLSRWRSLKVVEGLSFSKATERHSAEIPVKCPVKYWIKEREFVRFLKWTGTLHPLKSLLFSMNSGLNINIVKNGDRQHPIPLKNIPKDVNLKYLKIILEASLIPIESGRKWEDVEFHRSEDHWFPFDEHTTLQETGITDGEFLYMSYKSPGNPKLSCWRKNLWLRSPFGFLPEELIWKYEIYQTTQRSTALKRWSKVWRILQRSTSTSLNWGKSILKKSDRENRKGSETSSRQFVIGTSLISSHSESLEAQWCVGSWIGSRKLGGVFSNNDRQLALVVDLFLCCVYNDLAIYHFFSNNTFRVGCSLFVRSRKLWIEYEYLILLKCYYPFVNKNWNKVEKLKCLFDFPVGSALPRKKKSEMNSAALRLFRNPLRTPVSRKLHFDARPRTILLRSSPLQIKTAGYAKETKGKPKKIKGSWKSDIS